MEITLLLLIFRTEVVGGPNQSVSNSWINGVRVSQKPILISLLNKGRFAIGRLLLKLKVIFIKLVQLIF